MQGQGPAGAPERSDDVATGDTARGAAAPRRARAPDIRPDVRSEPRVDTPVEHVPVVTADPARAVWVGATVAGGPAGTEGTEDVT